MKGSGLGDALIGGMVLVGVLYWVWMALMAVLVPVVLVSAARSLRGIRRQLEAMNADGGAARPGAPGRLIAP